jgi:hypothetical protein
MVGFFAMAHRQRDANRHDENPGQSPKKPSPAVSTRRHMSGQRMIRADGRRLMDIGSQATRRPMKTHALQCSVRFGGSAKPGARGKWASGFWIAPYSNAFLGARPFVRTGTRFVRNPAPPLMP